MIINAQTKCLWILGHPVVQTVSPGLFNQAFASAGENYALHALDVPPAQLPQALTLLRHTANLLGCLLTIPHKLPAVQHMDALSERSRALGLVNIIRKTAQGLEGDALDGQGFVGALARHGIRLQHQTVFIIGCGGAGSASAWDALESGASKVGLHDVDAQRLAQLTALLAQRFSAERVHSLPTLPQQAQGWQVVLNTSPTGMSAGDPFPLPLDALSPSAVLVDAITPPEPSRWLMQAAARGHRVVHGPEFTRGQVLAMAQFFALPERVLVALSAQ